MKNMMKDMVKIRSIIISRRRKAIWSFRIKAGRESLRFMRGIIRNGRVRISIRSF